MFVRTVAGCTRLGGLLLVALAVATAQDKAGPFFVRQNGIKPTWQMDYLPMDLELVAI
ncbi:MAG TPA: hypothetical protein VGU46_09885 [Acidobacteriaceae bacterium]|nr:hypothetical protein [Acidobacteriaceae bacterium]